MELEKQARSKTEKQRRDLGEELEALRAELENSQDTSLVVTQLK